MKKKKKKTNKKKKNVYLTRCFFWSGDLQLRPTRGRDRAGHLVIYDEYKHYLYACICNPTVRLLINRFLSYLILSYLVFLDEIQQSDGW